MQYEVDQISWQAVEYLKTHLKKGESPFFESLGIPLLAEAERVENLWKTLQLALSNTERSQLVIAFVNQRENETEETTDSNVKTLEFFSVSKDDDFSFQKFGKDYLLVVNGTKKDFQLKENEGVGRARKVLADIALDLWRQKFLQSEIHRQTDGDAKVPVDYFLQNLNKKSVAGTYPFLHSQGELSVEEFSQLQHYEKWLQSYIVGLQRAGSRYAFWPLGSTLIFRLSSYEKVRGVPNVRAGEDFHFLSKLSKIGGIQQLKCAPIELRGRHSTRVPFGTGRALLNMKLGEKEYKEFPTKIFDELSVILKNIDLLAEHNSLENFLSSLNSQDISFFEEFSASFEKILKQKTSLEQKRKQLHECFDALKTMRWVNTKVNAN